MCWTPIGAGDRSLALASTGIPAGFWRHFRSSGVALLSPGRQKWPGSGGTARAEPAAFPPFPAALPEPPPAQPREPRPPGPAGYCPLACCRPRTAFVPGACWHCWQTPFTGRRGFSRRYSICFQESCIFSCSEEEFVGEGKPPYRGASSVPTKRPDCTAMPLSMEFVWWARRCFPVPADASFGKDTLILAKYPPAENTAHSGCACVGAACGLMVAPATWLLQGAVLLLPLPSPPSSPSYPAVMFTSCHTPYPASYLIQFNPQCKYE